ALNPAQEDFMYFVARPDGRHVFTRTLAEHNRAKLEAQRARDRISADELSEPTR
ncbi:MAG TPA: aminodeoxychorismate lyase, partial [Gemmatimonadetes bacterium]|nr:aminodeoxychorismate lyase [Gemmatimonadota bacterium]